MILPICLYGEKVLRKKCEEVPFKKDISELVSDMFDTMRKFNGCGLAAPQIGKSIMLFITEYPDESENLVSTVFINPKFSVRKGSTYSILEEGCLSIPGVYIPVRRADNIYVEYFNEKWQIERKNIDDFPARIFLHEYDHLFGKLISDYREKMSDDEKLDLEEKLKSISKNI